MAFNRNSIFNKIDYKNLPKANKEEKVPEKDLSVISKLLAKDSPYRDMGNHIYNQKVGMFGQDDMKLMPSQQFNIGGSSGSVNAKGARIGGALGAGILGAAAESTRRNLNNLYKESGVDPTPKFEPKTSVEGEQEAAPKKDEGIDNAPELKEKEEVQLDDWSDEKVAQVLDDIIITAKNLGLNDDDIPLLKDILGEDTERLYNFFRGSSKEDLDEDTQLWLQHLKYKFVTKGNPSYEERQKRAKEFDDKVQKSLNELRRQTEEYDSATAQAFNKSDPLAQRKAKVQEAEKNKNKYEDVDIENLSPDKEKARQQNKEWNAKAGKAVPKEEIIADERYEASKAKTAKWRHAKPEDVKVSDIQELPKRAVKRDIENNPINYGLEEAGKPTEAYPPKSKFQ